MEEESMTLSNETNTDSRNLNFRIAPLSSINLDSDVIKRLSQSLDSIVTGNQDNLRTPFLKELSEAEVLKKFDSVVESHIEKLPQALVDLELSNRDKFGPRSISTPWTERRASLEEYFQPDVDKESINTHSTGGRLRQISNANALQLLKSQTSSGLPKLKKKAVVKPILLASLEDQLKAKYPCVLYTRTQELQKTRNVWGYPISDTLNEMKLFSPILAYHKTHSSWRSSLLGPDSVDRRITQLLNLPGKRVSIDFSAYDSHVKLHLQTSVRDYIKSLFQVSEHEDIDSIFVRMNEIGIVTPDGIFSGPHGVPSGSTLTNEVDSDAQYLVANQIINPSDVADINGDDGAYSLNDPDKLISAFIDHGLVVNTDKSYIKDDYFIYLQNYYSKEFQSDGLVRGIYPIYRAYMRLVFQERWSNFEDYDISGQDYYNIRALSILENVRYHPLFRLLVQFVLDNDKFSLLTSEKGILNYVRMVQDTSGTQGIMMNQRGDDVKGIKNFASFKMVQEIMSS
uniref:RdRp n=1 Tax=viral metagenome TaxID=1070528 RepID=A0A2V0RA83_9ZZZZ